MEGAQIARDGVIRQTQDWFFERMGWGGVSAGITSSLVTEERAARSQAVAAGLLRARVRQILEHPVPAC